MNETNTNKENERTWFKNCFYKDTRKAKDLTGYILFGDV